MNQRGANRHLPEEIQWLVELVFQDFDCNLFAGMFPDTLFDLCEGTLANDVPQKQLHGGGGLWARIVIGCTAPLCFHSFDQQPTEARASLENHASGFH